MLKIGVAIAVPLVVALLVFPQSRTTIAGLAPFALFALCPLAMLFGMKGMRGKNMGGQPGSRESRICGTSGWEPGGSSCEHDHQGKPAAQKAKNAKVIQHAE